MLVLHNIEVRGPKKVGWRYNGKDAKCCQEVVMTTFEIIANVACNLVTLDSIKDGEWEIDQ